MNENDVNENKIDNKKHTNDSSKNDTDVENKNTRVTENLIHTKNIVLVCVCDKKY